MCLKRTSAVCFIRDEVYIQGTRQISDFQILFLSIYTKVLDKLVGSYVKMYSKSWRAGPHPIGKRVSWSK